MAHSRHAELAERARSIRARIASLHEELANVLAEQNALTSIGRITDDVLISVFAQAVSSMVTLGEDWDVEPLKISHICRRWRAVALGFPTLWTNIFLGKMERAKVYLDRSQASLLSVIAKPADGETLNGIGSFLAPHMHRIRRLDLYNSYDGKLHRRHMAWMDEFNSPAPALEEFRLTFASRHTVLSTHETKMFAACTLRLRSVALACVVYPPSAFFFHNLSRLELDAVYSPSLPLNSLLEILQRSPGLESLKLKVADESWDPAKNVSTLHVALPRLSDLRFVGLPKLLKHLQGHLTLPPTVSVHICPGVPMYCKFPDFRPLLPALTSVRHIRQMVTPHARTRFPYELALAMNGEDDAPVFQVAFDHFYQDEARAWLPKLAALCDMDKLLSCEFLDAHAFDLRKDTWVRHLAHMPALRTLRVLGGPASIADDAFPEDHPIAPVRRSLLSDLAKNNCAAPARLAVLGALAGDEGMCPALERLEFDWPWEDEEGLASGLEALSARRPSLVVVRRKDHRPLFVF